MSARGGHLSQLFLDQLHLGGGLSPEEAARGQAHLAACARCRDDAASSRAARERFVREVLPRALPPERRRRWFSGRALLFPLVLGPALALGLVLALRPAPGPELQTKGGAALQLFAHRGDRVFQVSEGAALAAGDEIRFAVAPAGRPYLLVASVDGAGKASIYFPFDGAASGRLDGSQRTELPGSVVLDDAPGPERIFALLSTQPLSAPEVTLALQALAARGASAVRAERSLPVPSEVQLSLVFEKSR